MYPIQKRNQNRFSKTKAEPKVKQKGTAFGHFLVAALSLATLCTFYLSSSMFAQINDISNGFTPYHLLSAPYNAVKDIFSIPVQFPEFDSALESIRSNQVKGNSLLQVNNLEFKSSQLLANITALNAVVEAEYILSLHPLRRIRHLDTKSLDEILFFIRSTQTCRDKPVFLSMAAVGSSLYWQLIENFVYTMLKFDLVECAIMVCVSDNTCMELCRQAGFPCYDFQYSAYYPVKLIILY